MFAFPINRTVLIVAGPADLLSLVFFFFLFQKWHRLILSALSTIQPFIPHVGMELLLLRDGKKA